jgi:uncharacterized damage-inducible protein DinB
MGTVDHYRRLAEHERWANARALESVRACEGGAGFVSMASRVGLPPREVEAAHRRAVSILGHVQWARRLWLSRLVNGPAPRRVETWTVDRLAEEARELDTLWGRYLDRLKEPDLGTIVRYTSTEGLGYDQPVHEILTQVFQHAAYHRGQIAMLVRQCGGEPAETDYIVFTRREAGATRT